jgi:hypothetical protein
MNLRFRAFSFSRAGFQVPVKAKKGFWGFLIFKFKFLFQKKISTFVAHTTLLQVTQVIQNTTKVYRKDAGCRLRGDEDVFRPVGQVFGQDGDDFRQGREKE